MRAARAIVAVVLSPARSPVRARACALDGKDDAACPQLVERGDATRCAWPSRLDLALDEHGGAFSQAWHVDAAASAGRWVPLPGDPMGWPGAVTVDGKPAVALLRWLRWGWDAFTAGEGWRKKPPKPPVTVVPFVPQPMPGPMPDPGPPGPPPGA